MKNRLAEQLYANANGYFWLPCPLCGEMFGGHEASLNAVWNLETGMGKMVCTNPTCLETARKSTEEYEKTLFASTLITKSP